MKALVCLLFVPAALALWVLGSPHVAWRVMAAFRRHRAPADDLTYRLLRVGATLALFSLVLIVVLISTQS